MDAAGKIVIEVIGDLNGEACFTDAARAGDGNEADVLAKEEFSGGGQFLFAADEAGALRRNIGGAGLGWPGRFFGEAVADSGEFAGEIAGGDVALVGIFCEATFDGPAKRSGDLRVLRRDGFRVFLENGDERCRGRASAEGAFAGDQLIED